jgi:hypothetical protein
MTTRLILIGPRATSGAATVWVRVCSDGTGVTLAHNGDESIPDSFWQNVTDGKEIAGLFPSSV